MFEDDCNSDQITVLTMPMLSPTMTEASLLRWLKSAGDQLEPYDLVFELETESLTEDAYKVGDFAGTHAIYRMLPPLSLCQCKVCDQL